MKKFRFSLDTVLDYKQQVLDSLRAEHGAILTQVREQERVVDGLEEEYRQEDGEFTRRKLEGITILEAMSYEQTEQRKLDALRIQEEKKRAQVVEARKETATIEKLREHKLEDYRKAEQKAEEQRIEEFVTTARAMAGAGIG